jgi:hypothetical protein
MPVLRNHVSPARIQQDYCLDDLMRRLIFKAVNGTSDIPLRLPREALLPAATNWMAQAQSMHLA